MTYPEAVRSLLGESAGQEIRAAGKEKPKSKPKNFSPPPPHSDMRRLYAYLLNERGIDRNIIHTFTHAGLMYEDAVNHNVCFVGKDGTGTTRHLHKRATNPLSDFKGNITGSDADYAFHYTGKSDRLYVFEAPIDLLAFLTLYPAGWQSKGEGSRSLQMIERPLMTPDELKALPKGTFIVTKTGFYPIKVKLKLFFKWGIRFEKEPFTVPMRDRATICYASREELSEAVCNKYHVADDKSNGKDIPDGSFRVEEAMAERHYSSKKAAARHKGLRTNLGQDGGAK